MKRFDQYCRHLEVLKKANQEDLGNSFIISGIIDKYSIQFELGWKVLKDLLKYEGNPVNAVGSPREIIKASYACFDFIHQELWLEMLRERNNTSHIYNEEAAKLLVEHILKRYIDAFEEMKTGIVLHYGSELEQI